MKTDQGGEEESTGPFQSSGPQILKDPLISTHRQQKGRKELSCEYETKQYESTKCFLGTKTIWVNNNEHGFLEQKLMLIFLYGLFLSGIRHDTPAK